jgi:hypothetical protein
MDYLRHHARAMIFSASMTPASVAAALASLDIIETEPALRDRLRQISVKMRAGFRAQGLEVGSGIETPIVPIFIGDRLKTMQVWRKILDRGVFVNAIVVPAVAPGRDLLRTSYMASHEDKQLDYILKVVGEVHQEVGLELASRPVSPGLESGRTFPVEASRPPALHSVPYDHYRGHPYKSPDPSGWLRLPARTPSRGTAKRPTSWRGTAGRGRPVAAQSVDRNLRLVQASARRLSAQATSADATAALIAAAGRGRGRGRRGPSRP